MFRPDDLFRELRQMQLRTAALERELRALRSERRPRTNTKRIRYKAVVSVLAGIPAGGSGQVTIYKNGLPTTWKPTAWHVWMHGDQDLDYDTEVVVEWWQDENRFEIASAGCTAGGDHEPLE